MTLLSTILLMALTRAEIIQRMRAPVVTQSDGLVQVYADCPEDLRREYQSPVARFAADVVAQLYRGVKQRPVRFAKPGIIVHIGDVRTNRTEVIARVSTNDDARVVSRIYLAAPAYADLDRYGLEVVKGFFRAVRRRELSDADALQAYLLADPAFRLRSDRRRLEDWLAGRGGCEDERALALMRKVLEPGFASRRDVLTFASRLVLYPPYLDQPFVGKFDCLSFRDALDWMETDPRIRIVAHFKANEMPVVGGGRGDALRAAADAYAEFLRALVAGERTRGEFLQMLDQADAKLRLAWQEAR